MSNDTADRWGKRLAIGGALLALVAVGTAISIMGSPMTQRRMRFDEKRTYHVGAIEREVRAWAKKHGALPATLDEVARQRDVLLIVLDPETKVPYEYQRIDGDSFRVCAVFATDTATQEAEDFQDSLDKWRHGIGRTCFTSDLDKGQKDAAPTAKDLEDAAEAGAQLR